MNFELTDEQRMLKETLTRFAGRYTGDQLATKEPTGIFWSRECWQDLADMGLLALPFGIADGGLGGGAVDMMVVMEALGGTRLRIPYFSTVALCGAVLRYGSTSAVRQRLVPLIVGGGCTLAFAHAEPQARYCLTDIATTAKRKGDGWILTGRKTLVLYGDSADQLIVSARIDGGDRDSSGVGLFLVDPDASGVTRFGYPTQDGMRAAEVELSNAVVSEADVIDVTGNAGTIIQRAVDDATLALCAESVGAMDAMLSLTTEYLRTRNQFGQPIGNFQALQHQAVEMFVELEQSRNITLFATLVEGSDLDRRKAVSAAKFRVGKAARSLGEKAIQLHGGIGMTSEYQLGDLFKRTTMMEFMFGSSDWHLGELARMGALFEDV